jgi:opacity protein-like surface antigen
METRVPVQRAVLALLFGSLAVLATCAAGQGRSAYGAPQGSSEQVAGEPAKAQSSTNSALAPGGRGLWTTGVGSGYRKGARQAGLALGPGIGTHALGSKRRHDLALTAVQFGRVFSDVIGDGRWYRGNAELVYELFGGTQHEPADHTVMGLVPLLRYSFAPGGRWVPFVNGGVGLAYTTISNPDLNGGLQFNIQVGAGVHYFHQKDRALTLQYRWFHLSNAGIRRPNSGVNTHLVFAGMSWLF